MTKKNTYTRKLSVVTKMNKEEYKLVLNAFYDSEYNTLGHYARDLILKELEGNVGDLPSLPTMDEVVADELSAIYKLLSKLLSHLELALIDESLFVSNQDKEKHIVEAMEYVCKTSDKLSVWHDFLKKNFSESIQQIACSTLTVDQLQTLVSKKEREYEGT
jgi:hypothetical protein